MDINPDISIGSPFISPGESYMMFQANLPGGFGGNDIYVSFRNEDGIWKAPVNLGKEINSEYSDIGPRVSVDGKYLFFSSYAGYPKEVLNGLSYSELIEKFKGPRNGYGTLFWVDAKVIEEFRPKNNSNTEVLKL